MSVDEEAEMLSFCTYSLGEYVAFGAQQAAMTGSVLPACLAVVLLSTPRLRAQWPFRRLVFALATDLQYNLYTRGIVDTPGSALALTPIFMVSYIPFITDCALLCRLLAFHPATITPRMKRIAIMAFPLAVQILRLPVIIATTTLLAIEGYGPPRLASYYLPLDTVGVGLQLLINCYCSVFLLHKVYQYSHADHAAHSQQASNLRRRLGYITESILFTFVPASLAQVAYFISVLVNSIHPYSGITNEVSNYLALLSNMFSIHFGLLAIWWSHIRAVKRDQSFGTCSVGKNVQDISLMDWALGPIEPESKAAGATQESPCAEKVEGQGKCRGAL